jgi:hypothetical protein
MLVYVRLFFAKILMLRVMVMDRHNSLSLTSLSLLYLFANVLHIWTLFILLNTF